MNKYIKSFLLWFFFTAIFIFFLLILSDFIEGYLSSFTRLFVYIDFIGFLMCQGLCHDFGAIIYFVSTPISAGIIAGFLSILYSKLKKSDLKESYAQKITIGSYKSLLVATIQIVLVSITLIIFQESRMSLSISLIVIYSLIFIKGVRMLRMIESFLALFPAFFISFSFGLTFIPSALILLCFVALSAYLFYNGIKEKINN